MTTLERLGPGDFRDLSHDGDDPEKTLSVARSVRWIPRVRHATREVYVVDDDAVQQMAIKQVLRHAGFLVRTYDDAADFLQDAPRLPPGCVITGLDMPGMDGFELIRRLEAGSLPLTAILMGAHTHAAAIEAMRAGARDLLPRPVESEALLQAVRRAITCTGRPTIGEGQGPPSGALGRLTRRERDVLRGVLAGKTSKLIARELAISHRTVELHRAAIMMKSGARNLPALVRLALGEGAAAEPWA